MSSNSQLIKTQTLGLDGNIAALLCYLIPIPASILWLVTEPKSNKFVRFHAAQSLFLAAVFVALVLVVFIGGTVLATIVAAVSGTLGTIVGLLLTGLFVLGALGIFVVAVIAMIKAFAGVEWEIPVIGPLARRFA